MVETPRSKIVGSREVIRRIATRTRRQIDHSWHDYHHTDKEGKKRVIKRINELNELLNKVK